MKEPIVVIAEILQAELGLAEGQVMLKNQAFEIPKDGLFIAVGYLGAGNVIGNSNQSVSTPTGLTEIQTVAMRHMVQIDIMSFTSEARLRKEEVLMALRSQASRRLQAENSMSIARNPGAPIEVSGLEGSQRLNRFVIDVSVKAVHRKEKNAAYFDTFKTPEVHHA